MQGLELLLGEAVAKSLALHGAFHFHLRNKKHVGTLLPVLSIPRLSTLTAEMGQSMYEWTLARDARKAMTEFSL